MEFNVIKCGVMHNGKRNLKFPFQINDDWVKSVDEERDLAMLISKDKTMSIRKKINKFNVGYNK